MKLKFVAAGVLALVATFGAQATTVSLGTLSTGTNLLPSESFAAGSFSYDFTFTTTSKDYFSVAAGDALTVKFLGTGASVSSFSANIDGTSFGAFATSSTRIGNRLAVADTLSYSSTNLLTLAAGTHTLHVEGATPASTTLNGGIYLAAAPVPEPESYALMLAGLGTIFTLVRRRKVAA